jgi:predicted nucleic acid-binding protein
MNVKTFVDSNILIYAHDVDAGEKQMVAREILRDLWAERSGAVSLQVLQEFYVNVTRKIAVPLAKDAARLVVTAYSEWCVETGTEAVAAAFRIEDEARIGFWDALIVAAAASCGADRILSEDLNSGQTIRGIRVENPFKQSVR